jgi:hypothetical protein
VTDDPREIIERCLREASGPDFGTVPSAAEHVYHSLCEAGLVTTAEVQAHIRRATETDPDPRFPPWLVAEVARVLDAEASDWILHAPREPHDDPAWRGDVRAARAVLGRLAETDWLNWRPKVSQIEALMLLYDAAGAPPFAEPESVADAIREARP